MDRIYLSGLKIEAIVGVWDWERRIPQTVDIDLEMSADIARAAATDDIADTLDYKQVAKRVQTLVEEGGFRLVETMAESVAQVILEEFEVGWVRVRINKPGAIRGARDVGVIIERSREA